MGVLKIIGDECFFCNGLKMLEVFMARLKSMVDYNSYLSLEAFNKVNTLCKV